jgi:hypothetical protein
MRRLGWTDRAGTRVLLIVLAVAGTASPARAAAPAKARVGVLKLEGAKGALIRARVTKALKQQRIEVVGPRAIEAAARQSSASLASNRGFAAVAAELAVSAFVTGEVGVKKAKLTVRNGLDGAPIGEATFTGANPRKLAAEVARGFWRRLGPAIQQGAVPASAKNARRPAAAEREDEKEEAEAEKDQADDDAAGDDGDDDEVHPGAAASPAPARAASPRPRPQRGGDAGGETATLRARKGGAAPPAPAPPGAAGSRPAFDVSVGVRGFSRSLTYHQAAAGTSLFPYHLRVGPALAVDAIAYPIAPFSRGKLAQLGLEAHVEKAVGVDSVIDPMPSYPTGATFVTDSHEYRGGLRYRIPLGAGSEVDLPIVEIGQRVFEIKDGGGADRTSLALPNVAYLYARGGLEARVQLRWGLSVIAGGGYRYVFNRGGAIADDYFPRLRVQGVDAHLGAGVAVMRTLEVRASVDFSRYFYDMRSQSGDLYLAGGAVDQYLSATIAAAFTLGR